MGNLTQAIAVGDAIAKFEQLADREHFRLRLQWGAEWEGTAGLMLRVLLEVTLEGPVPAIVLDDSGRLFCGDLVWTGAFAHGKAVGPGKLKIGATLMDPEEVWAIAI